MPAPHPLWSISFSCSPGAADIFAAAFNDALAVTVMSVPRSTTAEIEALYAERPASEPLQARVAIIAAIQAIDVPRLSIKQMPKLDWLEKVAGDFPPVRLARWTVHGAAHRNAVPDRRYALQIDATSAFGTGEHPTTRGCLLLLDHILTSLRRKPLKLLDMGCGSGILALAYGRASPGHALAVDLDVASVDIAKHNARVNGLQSRVRVGLSYGYEARSVKHDGPFDLIMANIFAGPLCHMAKDLKMHLRPGGIAILAGMLTIQADAVLAAHRMQKIYLLKRLIVGEWTILALQRRERAHSAP